MLAFLWDSAAEISSTGGVRWGWGERREEGGARAKREEGEQSCSRALASSPQRGWGRQRKGEWEGPFSLPARVCVATTCLPSPSNARLGAWHGPPGWVGADWPSLSPPTGRPEKGAAPSAAGPRPFWAKRPGGARRRVTRRLGAPPIHPWR